jgi:hypothetical protein
MLDILLDLILCRAQRPAILALAAPIADRLRGHKLACFHIGPEKILACTATIGSDGAVSFGKPTDFRVTGSTDEDLQGYLESYRKSSGTAYAAVAYGYNPNIENNKTLAHGVDSEELLNLLRDRPKDVLGLVGPKAGDSDQVYAPVFHPDISSSSYIFSLPIRDLDAITELFQKAGFQIVRTVSTLQALLELIVARRGDVFKNSPILLSAPSGALVLHCENGAWGEPEYEPTINEAGPMEKEAVGRFFATLRATSTPDSPPVSVLDCSGGYLTPLRAGLNVEDILPPSNTLVFEAMLLPVIYDMAPALPQHRATLPKRFLPLSVGLVGAAGIAVLAIALFTFLTTVTNRKSGQLTAEIAQESRALATNSAEEQRLQLAIKAATQIRQWVSICGDPQPLLVHLLSNDEPGVTFDRLRLAFDPGDPYLHLDVTLHGDPQPIQKQLSSIDDTMARNDYTLVNIEFESPTVDGTHTVSVFSLPHSAPSQVK